MLDKSFMPNKEQRNKAERTVLHTTVVNTSIDTGWRVRHLLGRKKVNTTTRQVTFLTKHGELRTMTTAAKVASIHQDTHQDWWKNALGYKLASRTPS